MTNANAYLGQKKDSPASLVGQYASIYRTAVGRSVIYSDCSTRYPSFTFSPEGCQDCTYWLRSRGFIAHVCAVGALATPAAGGSPETGFPNVWR